MDGARAAEQEGGGCHLSVCHWVNHLSDEGEALPGGAGLGMDIEGQDGGYRAEGEAGRGVEAIVLR